MTERRVYLIRRDDLYKIGSSNSPRAEIIGASNSDRPECQDGR